MKEDWPHAPPHRTLHPGTYMVTCGTYLKEHHFRDPNRLDLLHTSLLRLAKNYEWNLQAWAVFSNHYHFIATHAKDPGSLSAFLQVLHQTTSAEINHLDGKPGRQVWYQFWDTHLTIISSYFARLNYVIKNPVRHKLVKDPKEYKWCSASWFHQTAPPVFQKTIDRFKIDQLQIHDDF